jgi:hypothetical protein
MTLAIRFIPNAGREVIYAASHESNEVGQGRERDVRSSPAMHDPDRCLNPLPSRPSPERLHGDPR